MTAEAVVHLLDTSHFALEDHGRAQADAGSVQARGEFASAQPDRGG